MIMDEEIDGGKDAGSADFSRRYYLHYPVTNQRFVGEFSGKKLDSGDMLVANIPFGGMSEKDIVEVQCECVCPRASDPVVEVIGIADEDVLATSRENASKDGSCMERAKRIIDSVGIKMTLINAHLMPFSKMLVLFFSSPGRVDFRPALAPLSKEFRMNINLQQISFKSEAKNSDCFGICGRKLCCRGVPSIVEGVSVTHKKVRNQKESLNSAKMQGPCGKFFCCFAFEEEFYKSQKKSFPAKGDRIVSPTGEIFKVKDMNYVSEVIKAENEEKGVRSFRKSELQKVGNGEWKVADSI